MEKYGRKGIPYMEERYALLIDAENVSAKVSGFRGAGVQGAG